MEQFLVPESVPPHVGWRTFWYQNSARNLGSILDTKLGQKVGPHWFRYLTHSGDQLRSASVTVSTHEHKHTSRAPELVALS